MKVKVKVKQDHLLRLVNKNSPMSALAELIWNALDGDANRVEVEFRLNALHGLEEILVKDDGHGISFEKAKTTFESLGDSWKSRGARSPNGRRLHGRAGEGRFAAFALGTRVKWNSRWRDEDDGLQSLEIEGSRVDLGSFEISDPARAKGKTGTVVTVTGVAEETDSLLANDAAERLAQIFALYLRTYPKAVILYDKKRLDPSSFEERVSEHPIPDVPLTDETTVTPTLTIIEWRRKIDRALHLCDENGFSLGTRPPGIQASGFHFTAYVKCDRFRDWYESGALELEDLHQDSRAIIEKAKEVMRDHFRARAAEKARGIVEEWKEQDVYPYRGEPRDPIERAERQVFDVVALNVNEYLPDFAGGAAKSKKFSFQMLKSAIERSPTEARRIIQEVLDLPKEKQEELAELLDRTTLSSIINAAKVVADRLEFIAGLEVVLYQAEAKKKTRERKHLHRLLAENTWLFGEEFNLSVDDQSLNEVLRKHLHLLGDDRGDLAPVTTLDGSVGIIDLMLSRRIPKPRAEELEHLVLELKRRRSGWTSSARTRSRSMRSPWSRTSASATSTHVGSTCSSRTTWTRTYAGRSPTRRTVPMECSTSPKMLGSPSG